MGDLFEQLESRQVKSQQAENQTLNGPEASIIVNGFDDPEARERFLEEQRKAQQRDLNVKLNKSGVEDENNQLADKANPKNKRSQAPSEATDPNVDRLRNMREDLSRVSSDPRVIPKVSYPIPEAVQINITAEVTPEDQRRWPSRTQEEKRRLVGDKEQDTIRGIHRASEEVVSELLNRPELELEVKVKNDTKDQDPDKQAAQMTPDKLEEAREQLELAMKLQEAVPFHSRRSFNIDLTERKIRIELQRQGAVFQFNTFDENGEALQSFHYSRDGRLVAKSENSAALSGYPQSEQFREDQAERFILGLN